MDLEKKSFHRIRIAPLDRLLKNCNGSNEHTFKYLPRFI